MNANQFAALRTSPFLLLTAGELPYPEFFYHLEVVDHAHSVFGPIPFVELPQPRAGEVGAPTGTVSLSLLRKMFAVFDSAGVTVFRLLAWLQADPSAPRTRIPFSNESPAETTVHPTRGDQVRWNRLLPLLILLCHDLSAQVLI